MLILSLTKFCGPIQIDTPAGPVLVYVTDTRGDKARIGIEADREWSVVRTGNGSEHSPHPECPHNKYKLRVRTLREERADRKAFETPSATVAVDREQALAERMKQLARESAEWMHERTAAPRRLPIAV